MKSTGWCLANHQPVTGGQNQSKVSITNWGGGAETEKLL